MVDEYDLQKYMKLNHEVVNASWNDTDAVWEVSVKDLLSGNVFIETAEILVNGSGVLK